MFLRFQVLPPTEESESRCRGTLTTEWRINSNDSKTSSFHWVNPQQTTGFSSCARTSAPSDIVLTFHLGGWLEQLWRPSRGSDSHICFLSHSLWHQESVQCMSESSSSGCNVQTHHLQPSKPSCFCSVASCWILFPVLGVHARPSPAGRQILLSSTSQEGKMYFGVFLFPDKSFSLLYNLTLSPGLQPRLPHCLVHVSESDVQSL